MQRSIAAVVLVLLLLVVAWGLFKRSGDIEPAQARQLVSEGAVLVDVRSPGEFASGHIDGALNVPVQELSNRLGEIPEGRPVILYCLSGRRSAHAAEVLRKSGRKDIYNLGAMSRWQ